MLPSALKTDQFLAYPPQARALAIGHLEVLRLLPISFVPSLLKEVIDYDFKFPAERADLDRELAQLSSITSAQVQQRFQAFWKLTISPALEHFDWINQPAQFLEQLSAYLWSSNQMDAFRVAAVEYGNQLSTASPPGALPVHRLGIAIIGQGVSSSDTRLFRNLRKHGTYFTQVNPTRGLDLLLETAAARAEAYRIPYGHWYIDGGEPADHCPLLTSVSYKGLEPVRRALLKKIDGLINRPGMGPEQLRTYMARMLPTDVGMDGAGDQVLDRFQVKLFTEGSGTQIFSTTFAQWTAREALRRAQPLTLLVRFAPRQRQRPMNEMLTSGDSDPELDPVGSLVDADLGSYYQWLNQQRLTGSEQAAFVIWFEGHGQALAIGPALPRGTTSSSAIDLRTLVSLAAG